MVKAVSRVLSALGALVSIGGLFGTLFALERDVHPYTVNPPGVSGGFLVG